MLAVHAGAELVKEILEGNPEVRVANYNTPSQYILGGPRDVLTQLRSSLRKKRIPAVSISVSLLFHHPQMRILREHSLMRLNNLDMHAPNTPVMSVSKCLLYPSDEPSICSFIADLDENPVRFSECLTEMWNTHGIRSFLEIGPQEVLCGLIAENLPSAHVLSCGRKGREAQGMRELCARLYAEGYLPHIPARFSAYPQRVPKDSPQRDVDAQDSPHISPMNEADSQLQAFLALLARLSGVPEKELALEQDVRGDLGLRSSSFPLLLTEAEAIFQKMPSFEDLVKVTTVGDLLRVFRGEALSEKMVPAHLPLARVPALFPYVLRAGRPTFLSAQAKSKGAPNIRSLGILLASEHDRNSPWLPLLLPDLFLGLPGFLSALRVPRILAEFCTDTLGCRLPLVFFDQASANGAMLCETDWILQSEYVLVLDLAAEACQSCLRSLLAKRGARNCILFRLWEALPEELSKGELPSRFLEAARSDFQTLGLFNDSLTLIEYVPEVSRRRFLELEPILVRGLCFASSHMLWLSSEMLHNLKAALPLKGRLETIASSSFFRDELITCVVPDHREIASVSPGFFTARAYFSPHTDPVLQELPFLPVSRSLDVLVAAAQSHAPWLSVTALSDLSFECMPQLQTALVREGRLSTRACVWITLQGVQTRQIIGSLEVRRIKKGRAEADFRPLLSGSILLACEDLPHTVFSWTCPAVPDVSFEEARSALSSFYANASLPLCWQLCSELLSCTATDLIARLTLPGYPDVRPSPGACIAQVAEKEYITSLSLFEGCVQAALFFLSRHGGKELFRLSSAGLITLRPVPPHADPVLFLHRTWNDAQLQRFDVLLQDANGQTLLTVSQLEFEPVPVQLQQ